MALPSNPTAEFGRVTQLYSEPTFANTHKARGISPAQGAVREIFLKKSKRAKVGHLQDHLSASLSSYALLPGDVVRPFGGRSSNDLLQGMEGVSYLTGGMLESPFDLTEARSQTTAGTGIEGVRAFFKRASFDLLIDARKAHKLAPPNQVTEEAAREVVACQATPSPRSQSLGFEELLSSVSQVAQSEDSSLREEIMSRCLQVLIDYAAERRAELQSLQALGSTNQGDAKLVWMQGDSFRCQNDLAFSLVCDLNLALPGSDRALRLLLRDMYNSVAAQPLKGSYGELSARAGGILVSF